jgi:hypothetical protein
VARDSAREALDALEAGTLTWGILFWVPLMNGSDDPTVLRRWKEQAERVENTRIRNDLAQIALFFAELAGRSVAWSDALKEWTMYESQLFKQWTTEARREERLQTRREDILRTLKRRFSSALSDEITAAINRQDSDEMLNDWFDAALDASSLEAFLAVLRR